MQPIRKYLEKWYTYPILLFFVGAISYLYQLTQMGFYWDDWQAVLLHQINDPQVISAYFAYDRPFSAWTYQFLFAFLPMNPWIWQLLTMFVRGLAILALIEAFLLVWPKRRWLFNWVGLLLFVAPAFISQPIAVAFNQHFLTMLLFSLSLLLTGLAIKKKCWFWLFFPLSLLATAGHLITMEYFIGLEAARVLYIFYLFSQNESRWWPTIRKTALMWLPYGVLAVGFVYWRLAIYPAQFQGFIPNDPIILKQLFLEPLRSAIDLLTRMTKDTIYLMVNSWVNTISPEVIDFTLKANLFSWGIGIITALIAAGMLFVSQRNNASTKSSDKFYFQGLLLGIIAVIFGGLPVWLMARQIIEGKWSDRFSLAPMIGAVLILVIVVEWIIRTKIQKHIILAILLAFSIAFQMRNTNKYRLDWEVQRDFYWQLAWRAPGLKQGTAILSPSIPSEKISEYAVGYGINLLYAGKTMKVDMPYWFFTPRYLDLPTLATRQPQEIQYKVRNIRFTGSSANIVSLFFHSSARCLKVLDDIYQDDPFLKTIDPIFFQLTSNSQIISSDVSKKPSVSIFGREPDHKWCYYFQKADLARQNKQWQEVIDLMNAAVAKNFQPATGSELLPLLDAYLHVGNWNEATIIANQMITITAEIKPAICSLINRFEINKPNEIPPLTMDAIAASADCK